MKGTMQRLAFIFIAITSLSVAADNTLQRTRDDSQHFYQTLLDSMNTVFPGPALFVYGPGEYFNGTTGYANLQSGQLWQPDTLFYAGSIGKTFIAVAVLQLWGDNLLDLEDTLTRRLPPEITEHLTGADRITLRQLLNHTSGVADFETPEWEEAVVADPSLLWNDSASLAFAYDRPLQFEPGSQHRYSNTGYLLLGLACKNL